MKCFKPNEEGWYCGYWNQSPLQIKYSSGRSLKNEPAHKHSFAEYYFVLHGILTLQVEDNTINVGQQELIMIEAKELHKIVKKSLPECTYLIIKEKSYPQNKE